MPTDFNLFGIGPLELLALLVLVLILFNPRDIGNGAKNFGRFINKLTRSENFKLIQQTSREIQNLPARLAQEAEIEDLRKTGDALKADLNSVGQQLRGATNVALQEASSAVKDANATVKSNLADPAAAQSGAPGDGAADPYSAWKPKGPDQPA